MATKQALQEARPAAAASARPQVDYGQFDIREQGLCWQLGDDMHSARTGASTGRQHDVREQEEDARAQFREHRARKGGEGSQAAPQAPQSPRKGAPSLPAELREEFAKRGEDSVTIGEALEAAGRARADKSVDAGDASAIQSAVTRATGVPLRNDLVSQAERAADENERNRIQEADGTVIYEGGPHTLGQVLKDAARRLPLDKPATAEDARRVQSAEQRNDWRRAAHVRGVSAHVQAAAAFNARAERVAADEPRYPHGYKPAPEDPVLIGEALEVAGHALAEEPVGSGDARAVQAAVTRATGDRTGGPLGAEAVLLAALNLREEQRRAREEASAAAQQISRGLPSPRGPPRGDRPVEAHTLGQLLQHASEALSVDKAVTHEDARKVTKAEACGDVEHYNKGNGVAAQMQEAARLNEPQ